MFGGSGSASIRLIRASTACIQIGVPTDEARRSSIHAHDPPPPLPEYGGRIRAEALIAEALQAIEVLRLPVPAAARSSSCPIFERLHLDAHGDRRIAHDQAGDSFSLLHQPSRATRPC